MPSRAATSALAFAATCCMLDTGNAFVVQVPTMTTNNNYYWGGKKKSDPPNKVPVGGAVGFGQGHTLPQISGFAAGNVVHLPRVPSARDHAAQKRSRGSSCPPLELSIFDMCRELAEAVREFEECSWYDQLVPNEAWVESDEDDAEHNELKEPNDVDEPQREIVTTTAEEEVMVEQEEQEEEGMVRGQEKGGKEEEEEEEEGMVEMVVVEERKGSLSWIKKRVLTGGGGGDGGVPAVPELEWPLPGLVAVEGGQKKRPPMPDTDTQATGWLDDGSNQYSPMAILDPGIVHKGFRDPSHLQERSEAAYHSLDSSSSTTTTTTSATSSSEGSSSAEGITEKGDAAAVARAEAEAKDSEGGARAARKAGQSLKRWWGGVTRGRLR